jgi:hypothetical protein
MRDGEMGSATWFRGQSRRLLVLVCLASASCSVLIDKERVQCKTDGDCRDRGPESVGAICSAESVCLPDPVWGCLGSVVFPKTSGGPYTLTIHVRDLVNQMPISGVTAVVCARPDPMCTMPLTLPTPATPMGDLQLPLAAGFDGFLELRAPGRMPGLYFVYPPMDANREIPLVPMLDADLVKTLAELNKKELMPDRGHLLLGAYDCQKTPGEGIVLTSPDADEKASVFYVLNNLPKVDAQSTDASGRGGYINMKEGVVAITASLASDNRKIASVSLLVRPGMMTFTSIVPSPR